MFTLAVVMCLETGPCEMYVYPHQYRDSAACSVAAARFVDLEWFPEFAASYMRTDKQVKSNSGCLSDAQMKAAGFPIPND